MSATARSQAVEGNWLYSARHSRARAPSAAGGRGGGQPRGYRREVLLRGLKRDAERGATIKRAYAHARTGCVRGELSGDAIRASMLNRNYRDTRAATRT